MTWLVWTRSLSLVLVVCLAGAEARAGEVAIVAPTIGQTVPQEFTVTVTFKGDLLVGDTDGYYSAPIDSVDVIADDETAVGSCDPTNDPCPLGGEVSFDVTLTPGAHQLFACGGTLGAAPECTDPITITVEESAVTTTSDSTGAEDSASSIGDTGQHDGCGCRSAGPPALWLGLLGLLLPRRRRGQRSL